MLWRWGSRLDTDGLPPPTTLFATAEGLHVGDDFRRWNEILRTDRSGGYLYLFPDETRALIVPRRCFPNRAAFRQFVSACQSRAAAAGEHQDRLDDDPPPNAIRYAVSFQELARRNDEFNRRVGISGALWVRLPLAGFFTLISVAMWPWWQNLSAAILGPGNLVVAGWSLFPSPYERWISRWLARRSLRGEATREVAVWYGETGLWSWEAGRRRLFRWNRVGVAEPYNHSVVVYVGPMEALPIPSRAFQTEQAFETFVAGIRERAEQARAA